MNEIDSLLATAKSFREATEGQKLPSEGSIIGLWMATASALESTTTRLRTAESVVKEYDANFPCDGECNTNSGPEETCSRHGRSPSDLWGIVDSQIARATSAEDSLREAEACIQEALEAIRDRDGDPEGRIERLLKAEGILARYKTTKTEGEL